MKRLNAYKAAARWRMAFGPVASLILVLRDRGWSPLCSTKWRDPNGLHWCMVQDALDLKSCAHAVRETLNRDVWRQAASHHLGAGLEEGADLTVPRRLLRGLLRRGDEARAGLLRAVLCGGLWPRERSFTLGYGSSDKCPLCGQVDMQ